MKFSIFNPAYRFSVKWKANEKCNDSWRLRIQTCTCDSEAFTPTAHPTVPQNKYDLDKYTLSLGQRWGFSLRKYGVPLLHRSIGKQFFSILWQRISFKVWQGLTVCTCIHELNKTPHQQYCKAQALPPDCNDKYSDKVSWYSQCILTQIKEL